MKLINKEQLSEILDCKLSTVEYYVSSKQLPFIRVGKEVRFVMDSIMTWIKDREEQPTFNSTEGI
ncbi:helix-turn-helix domain-containing protein [Candidatus Margulisiibacteriota bacterium]